MGTSKFQHQHALPFDRAATALRRPPPETVRELEVRAAALAQRTVGELATALGIELPAESRRAKGTIGQLAERALGADPTAGDRPDFPELGVELKTIPVRQDGTPVESTFVCSVTMGRSDRERWDESRLALRLRRVLWLPVESAPGLELGARRFGPAVMWSPDETELAVLRADWEDLIGALGSGREVSGYEGEVLQLRPKGRDARTRAPGPEGPGVRPMGFYLRSSFTASILQRGRSTLPP